MNYADAGHRPHGVHTGEEPRNTITHGPESIRVTLDTWGPQDNLFTVLYDMLQSNWGDAPSRTVDRPCEKFNQISPMDSIDRLLHVRGWEHKTGWDRLTEGERAYVESMFAGKTLPQAKELITFEFTIDGVTRAFTHQNVRTRIGAAFMQHGGRDNDWRHRPWTMPETIRRACEAHKAGSHRHGAPDLPSNTALHHCVTDWTPIQKLVEECPGFDWSEHLGRDENNDPTLERVIYDHLHMTRRLYAALVDAGIPWQDARRVLPIGMQTYIHDVYNYLALEGVLSKRLEHVMDWEHNCVAQLMVREVRMKCPPILSKYLMSLSDRQQRAAFAGLESWPPDMKHDPNFPCECGHANANHDFIAPGEEFLNGCTVCWSDRSVPNPCQQYRAKDPLPRTHRPEQNPFFVLHPDSMNGGPIVWIPTNGTYPHDRVK